MSDGEVRIDRTGCCPREGEGEADCSAEAWRAWLDWVGIAVESPVEEDKPREEGTGQAVCPWADIEEEGSGQEVGHLEGSPSGQAEGTEQILGQLPEGKDKHQEELVPEGNEYLEEETLQRRKRGEEGINEQTF